MVGRSDALGSPWGEFHDQGDAKRIVIRRSLWGHNNTPCGRPALGRPIGRSGSGRPQGVFGGLSYYQLVMLISIYYSLTLSSRSWNSPPPSPAPCAFPSLPFAFPCAMRLPTFAFPSLCLPMRLWFRLFSHFQRQFKRKK
jgi:hypothetical protein